jgi:hypothetical protein
LNKYVDTGLEGKGMQQTTLVKLCDVVTEIRSRYISNLAYKSGTLPLPRCWVQGSGTPNNPFCLEDTRRSKRSPWCRNVPRARHFLSPLFSVCFSGMFECLFYKRGEFLITLGCF